MWATVIKKHTGFGIGDGNPNPQRMENQMEKGKRNKMEAGGIPGCILNTKP